MRTEEKTNYTIRRHGVEEPVYSVRVPENDLTRRTVTLKKDSEIYSIVGGFLTDKIKRRAKDGENFFVQNVLTVKSEVLHPSTWSQSTNLFLQNGNEYVYYSSAEKITDALHIALREAKKKLKKEEEKISSLLLKVFFISILVYFGIEFFKKKISE